LTDCRAIAPGDDCDDDHEARHPMAAARRPQMTKLGSNLPIAPATRGTAMYDDTGDRKHDDGQRGNRLWLIEPRTA
jgi:hypothetical protein